MVFRRLWDFAKRHRKKLIFAGVMGGGAYLAWRAVRDRVQRVQKLMEALNSAMEEGEKKQNVEEVSRLKRDRFVHKQEVSDNFARRDLATLRTRHEACFDINACGAKLKEAQDKKEKEARFQEFQEELLAFAISALYILHAFLLLHRVEYNIVGREIDSAASQKPSPEGEEPAQEGDADADSHTAFLESTAYFKEEGIRNVASAVRRAVAACTERAGLSPKSQVSGETFERFLLDTCRAVDAELVADSKGAATFLPDSVKPKVAETHQKTVNSFLDEARDCLDSPQFVEAFQAATAGGVRKFTALFTGGDAPVSDSTATPLAGGVSMPLAKLHGSLIKLSKTLLDEESGSSFVTGFSDEPFVTKLCEVVYFSEKVA